MDPPDTVSSNDGDFASDQASLGQQITPPPQSSDDFVATNHIIVNPANGLRSSEPTTAGGESALSHLPLLARQPASISPPSSVNQLTNHTNSGLSAISPFSLALIPFVTTGHGPPVVVVVVDGRHHFLQNGRIIPNRIPTAFFSNSIPPSMQSTIPIYNPMMAPAITRRSEASPTTQDRHNNVNSPSSNPGNHVHSMRSTLLTSDNDEENLSHYQCFVRKQIEIFVATDDFVYWHAKGRNKPVSIGQVGIRCRHCGKLPPTQRAKGAVYFPSQFPTLYQTAQNMASAHLMRDCLNIPLEIRRKLHRLREATRAKSASGGGRQYWAEHLRSIGVIESKDGRLRMQQVQQP